jgi:tetratricopeptide (TPR) repeat protein
MLLWSLALTARDRVHAASLVPIFLRLNVRRLPTLLLLAASLPLAHAVDAPEDVQAVFAKATQLLDAGHYAEAVPLLKDVTSRAPESPGGFMNLGLAAAESGDHRLAVQAWSRYHELVPNDTKAFGKIIQSYQALGLLRERDQVRDQLIAYRNSLPPDQRERFAFYVRDQFDVAGQHFIVLEYFEPKGPMRLYYKFTAVDKNHKAMYDFTLTSSDSETIAERELGRIGKYDRVYGLDKNEDGKSTVYDILTTSVSYDEVRSLVIGAMEGRSRLGPKQ